MRNQVIAEDLESIVQADLPWTDFEDATVLVTGANGFLPAYLVETLLYLNERRQAHPTRVIGLVRNLDRALARFRAYHDRADLQWMVQDVCDSVNVDGPLDYIIHAASQASPKYYGIDPTGTLLPNVLGTYHLLNLAREKSVKSFLFFSSSEIYGQVAPDRIPIKENTQGDLDCADVRSCYAESKRMGETMCVSWAYQYHVATKIVRPFHTYGPGMRLDDGRVFADFVADIVYGRDIVMKSDGSAIRVFCYLADATLGFLTVLLKGEVGQAYNIGNEKGETSILDLAHLLVELFPKRQLKVISADGGYQPGYLRSPFSRNCPDIGKARSLGWSPRISVREGFMRTIRSFLDESV